ILVLGKSELIPFAAELFEPIDLTRRIYRKDGRRDKAAAQHRLATLMKQESDDRAAGEDQRELGEVEQFHRDVVSSLHMPVVGTTLSGSVVLWNPAAAAFWGRSE